MLLIDMDMPKSCMECSLNYDQMGCSVDSGPTSWFPELPFTESWDFSKERHPDCPLRETGGDIYLTCRNCGRTVFVGTLERFKAGWKFCPSCGKEDSLY